MSISKLTSFQGRHTELLGVPARPTDCRAEMAAGRAFPVARQTMTSASSAAFSADTEEGRILLLLSSKVPAGVQ